MVKFWSQVKKVCQNELVCLGSMIIALMYGMYYLDIRNPLQYSLSEIGRFNHGLFIVWSVLSGIALLLNVTRLYARVGYKGKLGPICLYVALGFLVLTFANMRKDPAFLYWIHVGTAIVFALVGFASIAIGLLFMWKKDKRFKILTIILFSLILIDIVFLIIYTQMALFEFIPLLLGYVVMFFTNFTDSFKVELNEKVE